MVPPFLAYYGVSEGNPVYLDTAYKQIKLYRDALLDEDSGLWKHIVLGDWQSTKLWSPGKPHPLTSASFPGSPLTRSSPCD